MIFFPCKRRRVGGPEFLFLLLPLLIGCTERELRKSVDPPRTLVVVHASDMESELLPLEGAGGIARFQALVEGLSALAPESTLRLAAGDIFMPAPALEVRVDGARAVSLANASVNWDATAIGNHEFDKGDDFLAEMISSSPFAFLTSTVDFLGGPLGDLVIQPGDDAPWLSDHEGRILPRGKVCIGERLENGACDGFVVGIVGATTELLGTVASVVPHAKGLGDLGEVLAAVQREVDLLVEEGIDVIVLLSHLQGVHRELELVERGLRGVDLIVAGGGDDRLANPGDRLHERDGPAPICTSHPGGCYPLRTVAVDGAPVLVVATDGQHRYVGRIGMTFDEKGWIRWVDPSSRPWPVDDVSLSELGIMQGEEMLALEGEVRRSLASGDFVVARTRTFLNGRREEVRNRETNLGNLTADSLVFYARRFADADFAIRNAGGIRSSFGSPGMEEGVPFSITLLDVKRSLRFNDSLVLVTTTHDALRQTLEAALRGEGTTRGSFPQLSSEVVLVYDPLEKEQVQRGSDRGRGTVLEPGRKVQTLSIRRGGELLEIVRGGEVLTPDEPITFATLEYLVRGGDGYFPLGFGDLEVRALGEREPAREQDALLSFFESPHWQEGRGYRDPIPSSPRTFSRILALPVERAATDQ